MRIRITVLAVALVGLAALSVGAATTGAAGPKRTAAVCDLKLTVTITPGISLKATSGTFKSTTGTMRCTGTLFGTTLTARSGTVAISGSYGPDTCATGKGRGTFSATLAGKRASGSFSYNRAGEVGNFTGTARDGLGSTASIAGGFLFQPAAGQNCVQVKVTKATVTGAAVLAG
jgi:hypothetical protein